MQLKIVNCSLRGSFRDVKEGKQHLFECGKNDVVKLTRGKLNVGHDMLTR